MAEIAYHQVTKTYNPGLFKKKVRAVTDLNLEMDAGEVFGLIGPNGAGKSTSIRLLLGLTKPDSGTISFRGTSLTATVIQEHIGYLPENPYLYDHLTLRELLRFTGRTSGLSPAETQRRSQDLLDKLNLLDAQGRPLRTFSKGMLQRAGICFALLHDPAVVILDEPMSGLDPIGRKMVFDLVLDLKKAGKTIFFCSHILSDVERLCDRIGMMVQGRLVKEYSRAEFGQEEIDSEGVVHLVLPRVGETDQAKIRGVALGILPDGDSLVVSVAASRLAELAALLGILGVSIIESRAEAFSLEKKFMQVAEEFAG